MLCVGLTTLDVVHHLSDQPQWGHKQRSVGGELVAGGPAANAAVTAARLLGGARLVTAIGSGPATAPVRIDLDNHGVELIDLATAQWPLPVASALVDIGTGERSVVSPGALGSDGVSPGSHFQLPLAGVSVVLLDGHHPLVAARVATLAAQARIPVLLDAGSWKDGITPVLPRIGTVACSADYRPPDGPRAGDDPLGVATVLHRNGVATVVITDGPRPVVWSTMDGDRGTVEVPTIAPVDTLGAGDAFHGALAAAIAVGAASVPSAIRFAIAVAGVRCSVLGSRRWLADPELETVLAGLRGLSNR